MRAGAIVALVAILLLVLMAFEDLAIPQVIGMSCTTWMCDLYVAFRDFQTLLAGSLAIIAALIAARPVWLQLQSMTAQQEIASRSIIAERLVGMEGRAIASDRTISSFLDEINRTIFDPYSDDEYDPASVDVHWAHKMGHQSGAVIRQLGLDQSLRQDTADIERDRARLIEALNSLQDCFYEICAPAEHGGDPEISDEATRAMEEQEPVARRALPSMVSTVEQARSETRSTANREIDRLRNRLRSIDDALL